MENKQEDGQLNAQSKPATRPETSRPASSAPKQPPIPTPSPKTPLPGILLALALAGGVAIAAVTIYRGRTRRYRQAAQRTQVPPMPTTTAQSQQSPETPAPVAVQPPAPATPRPAINALVGTQHTVTINGLGSKGDGRAAINGKTVYIPGTQPGETVTVEVTADRGSVLLGKRVGTAPSPSASAPLPVARPDGILDGATAGANTIKEGQLYDVTITDQDRRNPNVNGVTRIGGKVVIVDNSQPGATVRIRIRKSLARIAFAEIVAP